MAAAGADGDSIGRLSHSNPINRPRTVVPLSTGAVLVRVCCSTDSLTALLLGHGWDHCSLVDEIAQPETRLVKHCKRAGWGPGDGWLAHGLCNALFCKFLASRPNQTTTPPLPDAGVRFWLTTPVV